MPKCVIIFTKQNIKNILKESEYRIMQITDSVFLDSGLKTSLS